MENQPNKDFSDSITLQDFPCEVLLKVLRNLDMKDLVECGKVSKKICAISYDKTLWLNLKKSQEEKIEKFFPKKNHYEWDYISSVYSD